MRTLALVLLLAAATARAQTTPPPTPILLSHQGYLLDGEDHPVSGSHKLRFSLYAQASGGDQAVWTQEYTVNFNDGRYSLLLGTEANGAAPLTLTHFAGGQGRYLGLSIDGGSEMTPRLRVGTVPFAAQAQQALVAKDLDCVGCVGPSELSFDPTPADGSVTTAKLADGAATSAKLADAAVTSAKLADGAVISAKLGAGAVGTLQLADGSVTTAKIAPNAITTQLLADGSVTAQKLAPGSVGNEAIASGTLGWDRLVSGTIPAARLPANPLFGKSCPSGQALTAIDDGGNPVCTKLDVVPPLASRLQNVAVRGGNAFPTSWEYAPGFAVGFYAAGGPVQVNLSIPMRNGSHSTCRTLVDGVPAVSFIGGDTLSKWQEGLIYSGGSGNWNWVMWNSSRMYSNIPTGRHTLTVQCSTDGGTVLYGDNTMVPALEVIPYADPANDSVKAYNASARIAQDIGCCSWSTVQGLATTFDYQGGPVRIAISIPMVNGGHSTCRPLIDGTPAGTGDVDNTGSNWQEGLTYTSTYWQPWNRTRVYQPGSWLAPGTHRVSVECRTDGGTLHLGDGDKMSHLGVVSYPALSTNPSVRATKGTTRQAFAVALSSGWQPYPNLNTSFTSNGGPVELGVSLTVTGGSHSACRPTVDGNPLQVGEPDDISQGWHNGIVYGGGRYAEWDRVRLYRGIPAGNHTLGVQCRTDSGTATFGGGDSVSTVWAVAYDQ